MLQKLQMGTQTFLRWHALSGGSGGLCGFFVALISVWESMYIIVYTISKLSVQNKGLSKATQSDSTPQKKSC